MGNQADKKFTWVIKNFSSLGSEGIYSDIFVVGHCKWRLLAYPRGINEADNINSSLYMVVPNPESLPSGRTRHAKFSCTLVNQIPGEVSQLRETQQWFEQKNSFCSFPSMFRVPDLWARDGGGFLVNGEVKIVAEVDVLEVIGKLDVVPVEIPESVDINRFQVLASQVEYVNSLYEKHPNIASKLRPKNPYLRTTYLNVLLSLVEILCKSPEELSNGDLADAYSSLRYVTRPGFKLDWLEMQLKEAGESRIQEIEQELMDLTQKREEMVALLKFFL